MDSGDFDGCGEGHVARDREARATMSGMVLARCWIALAFSSLCFGGAATERLQTGGEWSFIKRPPEGRWNHEAVLIIHGNGQTVTSSGSSWEQDAAMNGLMEALVGEGFLVAQSNHGATPENGMWGNETTVRGVAALADHIKAQGNVWRFHAVAVSAGGLTLANLLLNRRVPVSGAVLLAPVLSIESMYRCPGGIDRVRGIAQAFQFFPASACPGDPEKDSVFRDATAASDALRRVRGMGLAQVKGLLGATRWLALYSTRDPRVLPDENILPFARKLEQSGVRIASRTLDLETHSSTELLGAYQPDVLRFLRAHPARPEPAKKGNTK